MLNGQESELKRLYFENVRLRTALCRQYESHASIAMVMADPTELGIRSCAAQAKKFADEAAVILEEKYHPVAAGGEVAEDGGR